MYDVERERFGPGTDSESWQQVCGQGGDSRQKPAGRGARLEPAEEATERKARPAGTGL